MPEKELRKKVIGKNGLSNSLLALKIVFDLIPQILLVYLISFLIANNISEDNLKHIFLGIFIEKTKMYYGLRWSKVRNILTLCFFVDLKIYKKQSSQGSKGE